MADKEYVRDTCRTKCARKLVLVRTTFISVTCSSGAGDVGQAVFFKEVFEQKENLDIVSGPEIAVFLFGNKHDSAIGGIRVMAQRY